MIDVPGAQSLSSPDGVLYLAPVPNNARPPPIEWPKLFAKGVVFSLTASNPMGTATPATQNRAANAKLEGDIRMMRRPCTPRAWWRSFGFNAEEGWREDGFSIAFATDERAYALVQVMR